MHNIHIFTRAPTLHTLKHKYTFMPACTYIHTHISKHIDKYIDTFTYTLNTFMLKNTTK